MLSEEGSTGRGVMKTICKELGFWAASLPDTVGAEFDPHSSNHWCISGAEKSMVRTLNAYAARLFRGGTSNGIAP